MLVSAFVKTMQFIMNGSRQTYVQETFDITQTSPECIHRCTIVTFYILLDKITSRIFKDFIYLDRYEF